MIDLHEPSATPGRREVERTDHHRRQRPTLRTAGQGVGVEERVLTDEDQTECHDRQVEAGQPQRDRPDECAEGAGDDAGRREPQRGAPAEVLAEPGAGVGADRQEEGVAERDLPA